VRRTDQRRAAVVALYQRDVTGRPLSLLIDPHATSFTRELVEGVDAESYEQLAMPQDQVAESLKWIVPNEEIDFLYVDESPSDVQVPSAVELTVTETQPGVKGDTASGGGDKPATLESGVVVRVPLFVNEGDRVRVDTRSGEYVSRA
jgi:elongation factor P